MKIKLLLWVLLTGAAFGQAFPGTVRYVLVAPTGSCIAGAQSPLTQVVANGAGTVYACQTITAGVGTWTALGGGSGVTSFTVSGTTNQITVAGTCTVTSTGTCTLSLPSTLILPNGSTATTQTLGDNSTKVATDAFVIANSTPISSLTSGVIPQAGSATTIVNSSPLLDNGNTSANTLTYAGSGGIAVTSAGPAGVYFLGQGTVQGLGTNGVGLTVPTTVSSYDLAFPSAAQSGYLKVSTAVNQTGCTASSTFLCAQFESNIDLVNDVGATILLPANGGTGSGSLTDHGIAIAHGTSAFTVIVCGDGTLVMGRTGLNPACSSSPTLGGTGAAVSGSIGLSGLTSGTVTMAVQAIAGTWNKNLATTAGNAGEFETSGGGGSAPETWTRLFATNAQTGTYQVLAADFLSCKTIPVASGTFTVTLVASGSQPASGQCVRVINYGSGVVTLARSGQNINGAAANLTIAAGSASAPNGIEVYSDGTNYVAQPYSGSSAGTVSSVVIAGTSNQITAAGTCTITTTGTCTLSLPNAVTLGVDNSAAGTLLLANSAANAHTVWGSGATTTNTINGFAAVPATGDVIDCTVTSTTCLLHDAGFTSANVVRKDTTNTGGASMTLNMSASTSAASLLVPNIAGASSTTAGAHSYDTTNKMHHFGANGVDNVVAVLPASITPTNNDCVKFTVASSVITLNTAGAACGSGGAGAAGASLLVSTTDAGPNNTATETSLIGTVSTGSKTIAANTLGNNAVTFYISGYMSTPLTPDSLTVKFYLDSTAICTATYTPVASLTNGVFRLTGRLFARGTGAGGTTVIDTIFENTGTALTPNESTCGTVGTPVAIDFTASHVLDVKAKWNAAQVGELIKGSGIDAYIGGAPITSAVSPLVVTSAVISLQNSASANVTSAIGSDTGVVTGTGTFSTSNMACGDANGGITTCTALPNGQTATTQTTFSNDTKVATDAYVDTAVKPVFSTAVTGTSMATSGTNTVVVGPTTMVTPGANGAYRVVFNVIQTAAGSGGTCTTGSISISLGFKDADTGVSYAVGATANIGVSGLTGTSTVGTMTMTSTANGAANNFTSTSREFRAASGTAIQYQVFQATNSNCTTAPVFAVRPALYFMGY